jgi:hypothetical protein
MPAADPQLGAGAATLPGWNVLLADDRQRITAAYRVLHKEAREMEGKNVSPAVAVIVILIVIVIVLAVGWSVFLKKSKGTTPEGAEMSGPGPGMEGMEGMESMDTGDLESEEATEVAPDEGEAGGAEEGAADESEETTEEAPDEGAEEEAEETAEEEGETADEPTEEAPE